MIVESQNDTRLLAPGCDAAFILFLGCPRTFLSTCGSSHSFCQSGDQAPPSPLARALHSADRAPTPRAFCLWIEGLTDAFIMVRGSTILIPGIPEIPLIPPLPVPPEENDEKQLHSTVPCKSGFSTFEYFTQR